jgi:hypothetical protein
MTTLKFHVVAGGAAPVHLSHFGQLHKTTVPSLEAIRAMNEEMDRASDKVERDREERGYGRNTFGQRIAAAIRARQRPSSARIEANAEHQPESFGQRIAAAVKARQAARFSKPQVQPLSEAEAKRRYVLGAMAADEQSRRRSEWKCAGCGFVKHFKERVSSAAAGKCPRCRSTKASPAAWV